LHFNLDQCRFQIFKVFYEFLQYNKINSQRAQGREIEYEAREIESEPSTQCNCYCDKVWRGNENVMKFYENYNEK